MTYSFRFRIKDDKTLEFLGDDGGAVPVGYYEVAGHEDGVSRRISISRTESNGHPMATSDGESLVEDDEWNENMTGPRGGGHAVEQGDSQYIAPRPDAVGAQLGRDRDSRGHDESIVGDASER